MRQALREVLPRDGFQDVESFIGTDAKIAIIEALHDAGCRWIEVTSFVHPHQLPQFVDAEEVAAAARALPRLTMSAFVPNAQGLQRALASRVDEASIAISSTDALSLANFHRDRTTMQEELATVAHDAADGGSEVSLTIGGAFGCPFEGLVSSAVVLDLVRWALDLGVASVVLADTIGAGTPDEVASLVEAASSVTGEVPLGVHIHGVHGAQSVARAFDVGASFADGALGGLGGCPFVPDAPGNVDTRKIRTLLADRGVDDLPGVEALEAAAVGLGDLLAMG